MHHFRKPIAGECPYNSSFHQIPQLTTTLCVVLITRKLQCGSLKEKSTGHGNPKVHFFVKFMGSVHPVPILALSIIDY